MSRILDTIVLVGLTALLVYGAKIVHNRRKTKLGPNTPPLSPTIVDGVAVGYKTYADMDNRECVHVLNVRDGIVEYTRSSPSESTTDSVQNFLERYYRTPNGCDFEDDSGNSGRP